VHKLSAHACSSIRAFDWAACLSPVEVAMNDTFPHDTSGCAASANTVRGCCGNAAGPSESHYIIGPLQNASGPRKKEKTAMSHFWDTHHIVPTLLALLLGLQVCNAEAHVLTGASMRGVRNRVFFAGGYMGVFFTFLLVWCVSQK